MGEQAECLQSINIKKYDGPALKLSFKNIVCKVTCNNKHKNKVILNDVSGTFHSGKITAILGPSGSGKTTLINILAGYKTRGVTGTVLVNNQKRVVQDFQWQSCCISQDAALLPLLTTEETLNIAADLKMSAKVSKEQKQKVVSDIIDLLGLRKAMETRVSHLSGGEVKRLSIGVELVTNPPIMLFDEPTSGLDSVSSGQVVSHLRALAQGGHTVVCVIHQPSSRLFDMFDDLYVMANGRTIYGGPAGDMVSSLQAAGFKCPQYYNRADFVLEVASFEIDGDVDSLMTKASTLSQECMPTISSTIEDVSIENEYATRNGSSSPANYKSSLEDDENSSVTLTIDKVEEMKPCCRSYAISHWKQFTILLKRSATCTFRDMQLTRMRIVMHALVGLVLGAVYFQIGNEAPKIISNSAFLFFILLFIFFSNSMPTVLTFPQEAAVFQRESLNNWYSTPAYYFSKIVADLPLQLLCPTVFMMVSYFMTGQPVDCFRVAMVWLVCVIFTIISQGCGLVTGVAFEPQLALFFLPALTIPMLMFSGFFIRFEELPEYMKPFSYISYFGYGFEAILQAVYGYDRPTLKCDTIYCHLGKPKDYLREMGIRFSYTNDLLFLSGFAVLIYCILFALLKFRVWKSRQ